MRRLIFVMLILALILIAGCVEKRAQPGFKSTECDAEKPCDEGYECVKLPEVETPVCVLPEVLESDKYKDCAVLESYPVQLKCPSKPKGGCESDSDCKVSGCNGELCSEQEMMSICVYKPGFECYSLTNCKCINGRCGWEQTEEFRSCLIRGTEKQVDTTVK